MFVGIVRFNVHVQGGFSRSTWVICPRKRVRLCSNSFIIRVSDRPTLAQLVPLFSAGANMIELAVHPEIHAHEQLRLPTYSTCRDCHRSFHAKSEGQLSQELCDHCLHALRFPEETMPTVHVKVLPHR